MPQNRNNEKPPEVMTWGKASLVLAPALIFDALRFMFVMFWFFGPALAALLCTLGVNGAVGTTLATIGGKAVAGACTAVAGAAGFFGVGAIESFGTVMAMLTGLAGWMTIGLLILLTNARLLSEIEGNMLWFVGSLALSEVPFVDMIPALSGTMVKLYSAQIQKDKEALIAYEKAHADEQLQERRQQAAELMQAHTTQVAAEQEAANDEMYAEAANDDQYKEIPEEERKAA